MKSLSQIETTAKRASKASGFSWGEAEEIGKCIRQLEMFGLPGIKHLNSYFKDKKGKETDFDTPIFDIPYINSIIKDLNLYRTRVMNMKSKSCYTIHRDWTKRIHIPVITNEHCFLIVNNEIKHYPADGNHYLVDTTQLHTAVNASRENRIHIVGVVV